MAAARALTSARRDARALSGFPGHLPPTLDESYAVQDAAIALWPDRIAGWKVGRVPDALQARLGQERVAGPVFARHVWPAAAGEVVTFPVIPGGFAAVEAEFVVRVADVDPSRTVYSDADVLALVGDIHIGAEIAGSAMAMINEIGPLAVASDFGNNAGLILGPRIADWGTTLDAIEIETVIDGATVGRGRASSLPGGPLASLRFLAEHCARRGRPLTAGQLVSTGAATGVHDILAGQSARLVFGDAGEIKCKAAPATAG